MSMVKDTENNNVKGAILNYADDCFVLITKEMLDRIFNFIFARRYDDAKKEVRGVSRNADFPENLLINVNEDTLMSDYMFGTIADDLADKYHLSNRNTSYYWRLGKRYEMLLELYWSYRFVMQFLEPVLQTNLEDLIPNDMVGAMTIFKRNKTVQDFFDSFTKASFWSGIAGTHLLRNEMQVFIDIVCNKCYMFLDEQISSR